MMKLYLVYLISNSKLYAITEDHTRLKKFLSERNRNLFKVIPRKLEKDDLRHLDAEYRRLKMIDINLESSDGDFTIVGTIDEESILTHICEKMESRCNEFKLHFTKNVPFNKEYLELLDSLTTIVKNINNHPIIQIDSVRLFYYLFKDTFLNIEHLETLNDEVSDSIDDYIEKYRSYF